MSDRPRTPIIILDLGNVVLSIDHLRCCRRLGKLAALPADEVYARIFTSGLEESYDEGRIGTEKFFDRLQHALGLQLDFEVFREIWCDIFSENRDVVQVIGNLKSVGYRLLLLSNTNELHWEHAWARYRCLRLFDDLILSYRVGARKPKPQIFDAALRLTGQPSEQHVYIDDIAPFAEAASALGMKAYRFTGLDRFTADLRAVGVRL